MQRLAISTALVVAYAWWASNVSPFTGLAYLLIALPSATLVVLFVAAGAFSRNRADVDLYYQERRGGASLRTAGPWLVLLGVAIALEVLGLALGGRSSTVPTLSTTTDHLLVTHAGRAALLVLWLGVGVAPLWRLRRYQERART